MRSTQSQKQTGGRRRRTEAERDAVVEKYWKSGRTQRVFALEAGISASALQRWLEESRRRESSKASKEAGSGGVSLLEVELVGGAGGAVEAMAAERQSYEIMVKNGTRLRVPVGFRDESVRRLLRLMEEVG